jgi:hypothetical protein
MTGAEDLSTYLPVLLAIAGGALQFLMRQFKGVPEWTFYLVATGLAFGAYFLVHDVAWTRASIVALIIWLAGAIPAVLGGTFLASSGAKGAASVMDASKNPLLPLTDSK